MADTSDFILAIATYIPSSRPGKEGQEMVEPFRRLKLYLAVMFHAQGFPSCPHLLPTLPYVVVTLLAPVISQQPVALLSSQEQEKWQYSHTFVA